MQNHNQRSYSEPEQMENLLLSSLPSSLSEGIFWDGVGAGRERDALFICVENKYSWFYDHITLKLLGLFLFFSPFMSRILGAP